MIYGITGNMGAGKTAVSKIIRDNGYAVLDADMISREVLKKDAPLLRILVKEFGIEIIDEKTGELNRTKLADIAFSDKAKTARLNDLVQTAVLVKAFERIFSMGLKGHNDIVFFDVPMLYEAEWDKYMDEVWLVTAPEDLRIQRVLDRDSLSLEQIKTRMNLQMSEEEKIARADQVINNSSDMAYMKKQVTNLLNDLKNMYK